MSVRVHDQTGQGGLSSMPPRSGCVRLRGHHLLCMLVFAGRGYSPAFVQNMTDIMHRIREGSAIEIVSGPDDICLPEQGNPYHHCAKKHVHRMDHFALLAVSSVLGYPLRKGEQVILSRVDIRKLQAAFQKNDFVSHWDQENCEGVRVKFREACKGCNWHNTCSETAVQDFSGTVLRLLK